MVEQFYNIYYYEPATYVMWKNTTRLWLEGQAGLLKKNEIDMICKYKGG